MNKNERGIYLGKLIENIINTKYEDIPSEIIAHAKNRIIDAIGCLICGAKDTGNPELINIIRKWGGNPEATVLVYGDKVPVINAAMANCILCRSFDYEPVSPMVNGISVPGHISGTTVMTALAVGEWVNASGKEVITSLLVGDDMATRVLVAGKGSGTRRGFDHIGQANSFGAVAIGGRLIGLSFSQMRNAFGLVINHLGGSQQMISDLTTGFKLSQGTAARDGIFAVLLAQAGWTGPEDALLAEFGYYSLYTDGIRDPEILIKDLGKKYYSDGTFKPYPCCRINHAAIDCALSLKKDYGIESRNIQEVILYASPGALRDVLGKPFKVGNFPHGSAGFSLQYNVANALLRGYPIPEHFTEQAIRDPQIGEFVTRIKMAELTEGKPESAGLKVIMTDGRVLEKFVEIARGDPQNPISREEILNKFWHNIEFAGTITKENAEKILRIIDEIEKIDSIRELINLVVA